MLLLTDVIFTFLNTQTTHPPTMYIFPLMTQAPGLSRQMLRSARFFHVFVSGLYLSTVFRKSSPYPPKPKHLYKRTVSATGNEGSPENQIESISKKIMNIVFLQK